MQKDRDRHALSAINALTRTVKVVNSMSLCTRAIQCAHSQPRLRAHAGRARLRTPQALGSGGSSDLWVPPTDFPLLDEAVALSGGGGAAVSASSGGHKPRTPPPDLPSLLLNARIVYLGMPLVPAVTELMVAELLYLQYSDGARPLYLYINSTGTTRADGETIGFETEGTAILDTMRYVQNDIFTVGVGVAYGQSAMLLSAGSRGKRFMLPHATALLQQPRMPPTGARQAIEVQIRWREAFNQYQNHLKILSETTGHSVEKLDYDMQRPLYMTPVDAIEYGLIDKIVKSEKEGAITGKVLTGAQYDKQAGLVARQ